MPRHRRSYLRELLTVATGIERLNLSGMGLRVSMITSTNRSPAASRTNLPRMANVTVLKLVPNIHLMSVEMAGKCTLPEKQLCCILRY